MNIPINPSKKYPFVQMGIKLIISLCVICSIFSSMLEQIYLIKTDTMLYVIHLGLVSALVALLCYAVFHIENLVKTFRQADHKISFLYGLYYGFSVTLAFNPLDNSNIEVVSFKRVIGDGILGNVDVSRRISNFNHWFILFAVSFILFYLLVNEVRQRQKSEDIQKAETFLDNYMILANCCLVFRGIAYFQSETGEGSCNFISLLIMLIALVAQVYILLRLDRWISVENWGKLGIIGVSASYSVSIFFSGKIIEWEILAYLIVYAAVICFFCFASKKFMRSNFISALLNAGVVVVPCLPVITSLYIELVHILNQHNIHIYYPERCYKVLPVAAFFMWIIVTVIMLQGRKWRMPGWKRWTFPVLILGIACLSRQIPLVMFHQLDMFESANYGVLINDFLNFGKIPNIEHYGGHMMTAVWEGILYGILNRDYTGAFVSPYASLLDVVQILLFYFLLKNIWNEDIALATTLLFPFYKYWHYFGLGMLIFLLVIGYVRKSSYFRAALLWAGFIWCALYRLDLGFAFGLSAILTLACYIVATKKWKAIKELTLTLLAWVFFGVVLWSILCLAKGIHPVNRLLEFLHVNMSNQNWAYKGIGNVYSIAFGWSYVLFPLFSAGALAYACLSEKMRRCIGMEQWLLLLLFGFSYIFNFSRGLVRHSLVEITMMCIFVSGYIFLAMFVSCYKNNRRLFLPVFLACLLCEALLLPNANIGTQSVAEESTVKTNAVIENWYQFSEINVPVQRVVVSQQIQDHVKKFEILDMLLTEDETFVDFINQSTLYPLLGREDPAYISQLPLQLSGEFMQRAFIKQIEGVPLILMPANADRNTISNSLDGVANAYRYYLVSEYIYQNYVPLFSYYDDYAVWCLKGRYHSYINKIDSLSVNVSQSDAPLFDQSIKLINFGYDGPQKIVDAIGDISYEYSDVLHNYSLMHLPRIWGAYDQKSAIRNKVFTEFVEKDGIYYAVSAADIEKSHGNYLMLTASYDGFDSTGTYNEYLNATVVMGSGHDGQFEEKAKYQLILREGTHEYLLRCSADYYWYLDQIDALYIQTDGMLQNITVKVLEGD